MLTGDRKKESRRYAAKVGKKGNWKKWARNYSKKKKKRNTDCENNEEKHLEE